jgi:type II secretory pathway pseudopilin PulG
MLRVLLGVTPSDQGWTLMEALIVVLMVGILSAMGFPSLLELMAKQALKEDLHEVKGALQEIQRVAIKKGMACNVTITSHTVQASPSSCLPSAVELDDNTTLELVNFPGPGLQVSYRGTFHIGGGDNLILFHHSQTSQKYCLALSEPLGLLRPGVGSGSTCSAQW